MDSTWSWVVCLASAWIFFWGNVIVSASGVLFVHMMHSFSISREQAFWPFSLANTLYLFMGPLAGALIVKGEFRFVSFLGTTLATLFAFLCFVNFNYSAVLTFLALTGVGQGLFDAANNAMVNELFDEQLSLAIGVNLAGMTLGPLIFPPITQLLVESYGLRGTFLLLSGFSAHAIAGSLFLRPPLWVKRRAERARRLSSAKTRSSSSTQQPAASSSQESSEDSAMLHRIHRGRLSTLSKLSCMSTEVCTGDVVMVYAGSEEDEPDSEETLRGETSNDDVVIFQKGRISNAVYQPTVLTLERSSFFEQAREKKSNWGKRLKFIKNPLFFLVMATWVAVNYVHVSFVVTIMDLGVDKGMPARTSSLLISIFFIGQLVGKVLSGFVSKRAIMTEKTVAMLNCGFLSIVLMAVAPACKSYASLAFMTALVGYFSGSCYIVLSLMLGMAACLEDLSTVFSCSTVLIALITLARPKLIANFRDTRGSYEGLHMTLGAVCLVLFVVYFFMALYKRLCRHREPTPAV